jgi:hypothetical protein
MANEADVQETVDYLAIRRLQSAYADILDRRAFGEMHEIFLPSIVADYDGGNGQRFHLEGPDGVARFIAAAIEPLDFFEFVVLNARVWLSVDGDSDHAAARVFISELRQHGATGRWHNSYGVYHDHYRRVDGQWWYERRRYHSLARTARAVEVFPFPSVEAPTP